MKKIKQVILHCSDTPDYPYGSPDFDKYGAVDIDYWHIQRGFDCIGYHWVVRRSGIIEKGRMETIPGAHCLGQNHDSIGVCYIGRSSPTTQQIASLYTILTDICRRHNIEFENVYGHGKYNPSKQCPGISMHALMRAFLEIHSLNLDTILFM